MLGITFVLVVVVCKTINIFVITETEEISNKTILKNILKIGTDIKIVNDRLTLIEQNMNKYWGPHIVDADDQLPQFPLTDMDMMENFEAALGNDTCAKQFVAFVSKIGGISVKDYVKRALNKILSNTLAERCSWTGRKNDKKPVRNTKLMNFIKGSVHTYIYIDLQGISCRGYCN